MKTKDLEKLGLTAEALEKAGLDADVPDKIFALHGKGLTALQAKVEALEGERDTATEQLAEANKTIESFKGQDIDGVKKTADEWKAKYDQAVAEAKKAKDEADKRVKDLEFDTQLKEALKEHKVKDPDLLMPKLKKDKLVIGDDGKFVGLEDQLKPLQESHDYLFSDTEQPPKIIAGGHSSKVTGDAMIAAARRGAGLPDSKE